MRASSKAKSLEVPASIDATSSRDVSDELEAFINNAPNGSTIVFKAGGTYRLGNVLSLFGKKGITLEGNGATLRLTGDGFFGSGIFVEQMSENTTIRDLTIVGNHSTAGTDRTCCGNEGQHGIAVWGSKNTLIERVDVSRIGGDCFYMDLHDGRVWPDGVTVRGSSCRLTGRHGVGLESGRNIVVANNRFDKIGMYLVDIEPGDVQYGASNVVIRNNTVGTYGHTDLYFPYFLAACDAPWNTQGSVVRDVTVTGNTVEGGPIVGYAIDEGIRPGLMTMVCGQNGPNTVRENFTFTNNVAKQTADGVWWGVLRFRNVNGVTVTGNKQPLSGGSVQATFEGSTNVTYRP